MPQRKPNKKSPSGRAPGQAPNKGPATRPRIDPRTPAPGQSEPSYTQLDASEESEQAEAMTREGDRMTQDDQAWQRTGSKKPPKRK